MKGILSRLLGGNKSEKDVKKIQPQVAEINQQYEKLQSLSNDELRSKTVEFKGRIKEFLKDIDQTIQTKKEAAEALPSADMVGRDNLYREIDELKKDRDKKIEEVLNNILPEAFAVVK